MTQEHVAKGQGDWQKPFNDLIDFKNSVGGGTVTHLESPLSFENGVTAVSNDIYYTENPGGYRRCYLSICQLKADSVKTGDQIWQFPDGLKPIDGATIPVNESDSAIVWRPGDAHLFKAGSAWGTAETLNESYIGFSYLAKTDK